MRPEFDHRPIRRSRLDGPRRICCDACSSGREASAGTRGVPLPILKQLVESPESMELVEFVFRPSCTVQEVLKGSISLQLRFRSWHMRSCATGFGSVWAELKSRVLICCSRDPLCGIERMDRKPGLRRWFRFSLRTLFATVTVFALVSWGAPIVANQHQAWRARQAVRDYIRAFEQCGGGLSKMDGRL